MIKERPILYKGDMVCAILDGRKTQTRRLNNLHKINDYPERWKFDGFEFENGEMFAKFQNLFIDSIVFIIKCPFGKIGDQLWVRETFGFVPSGGEPNDFGVKFFADNHINWYRDNAGKMNYPVIEKKRPSIFMPRWASRIQLEIINIRVERVQEISEEDAIAEGCFNDVFIVVNDETGVEDYRGLYARERFEDLWDSINGNKPKCSWKDNPWVWVIIFKRIKP